MRQGARILDRRSARSRSTGSRGALLLDGEARLIGVWARDIADGRVQRVGSIVNPNKLRHIGPLADLTRLTVTRGVAWAAFPA